MNYRKTLNINKNAVANSFSKAADHYDQFAQLQRDIGLQLLHPRSDGNVKAILDLGCGTGYFSEKITQIYPHCEMTCLDLSAAMLAQVGKKNLVQVTCLEGDIDHLPFSANRFDMIFSNLVLQWSEDLPLCLQQLKACLAVGGTLYFSTLLSGSLNELTQAWKSVDLQPHTNAFLSLESIKNALQQAGFTKLTITTETRILSYQSVIAVMRALKGIGANHVHGHRAVKISGRNLIKLLEQGYLPFVNGRGELNLTYQVCYVEAQK
ncbi:MAG: malonyl-CoA O-methyltransferase [Psychromonas sp.]|jgi:malonyl-CoA O-methyltransferase|uniref:malonyl-ACP O-methyltransferase BioC n=1 Tax=Psychromonas sp. TaxID=1884585 RepID=UPI0039E6501D